MADIDAPPLPHPPAPPAGARRGPAPLVVAGLASLGAGAVHAAAIGVHSEHRPAVLAFTALAVAQMGWGAVALTRGGRLVAAAGTAVAVAALAGWGLAKTVGIGLVAGLDAPEGIQWADGAAALLAAVALVGALAAAVTAGLDRPAPASPATRWRGAPVARHGVAVAAVAALSVTAMVSAGSHSHAGGHGEEAAGHHDGGAEHAEGDDHPAGAEHAEGEEHGPAPARPAQPYDPALPLDFGGVEGVTPEQQAAAENLVAVTVLRLPQFADAAAAEAAGWASIGDGFTGHEHLINWDLLADGRTLDPDHPEALVYDTSGGGRRLVSAMFMLEPGSTLDTTPELGGALTQWHIHDNLCFVQTDGSFRVAGVTAVGGSCRPPTEKLQPVPMIHVWIEPHPCGPFAALEGVAAGQVRAGEEQLCDHAHGSG